MKFEEKVINLAKRLGAETEYLDTSGKLIRAPLETCLLFIKAMGFEINSEKDLEDATNTLESELLRKTPVILAKNGKITLPSSEIGELTLVNQNRETIFTTHCQNKLFQLPENIPFGYYFLQFKVLGNSQYEEIFIIHSPMKAYLPTKRSWGLQLGLYSLQSPSSQGIGDFADLAKLQEIITKAGASYLGLLPLHLMDKENPLHTSPYYPLDRFVFDPIYLPLVPHSENFINQELETLRKVPWVNYQKIWKVKEKTLCRDFKNRLKREGFRENLEHFLKSQEKRFAFSILYQVLATREGNDWRKWPPENQKPHLKLLQESRKKNEEEYLFHIFLQWLAHEHFKNLTSRNKILALDLPLGFAPYGAESWIEQEKTVSTFTVGAPPDTFSPQGQNWGFHPFNPYKMRESHYQHFISLLRFNMQYAAFLRFDHILALKRLFWIPKGAKASEGLYVRYPTQELLGILTLESWRNKTAIIGEDLGTVPKGFRKLLQKHDLLSTRVFYFELDNQGYPLPPEKYPPKSIFLFNTHDMPTLQGFLKSLDLKLRQKLGIFDEEAFVQSLEERKEFIKRMLQLLKNKQFLSQDASEKAFKEIFEALLAFANLTPSLIKALSLEDLLEKSSQPNLPGTTVKQYPNWRKKHRISWDFLQQKIAKIATVWNEPT